MSDQGELYDRSWILYYILDRFIGNREIVAVRRELNVVSEKTLTIQKQQFKAFFLGSKAEGMEFPGSDIDKMLINKGVIVMCQDKDISNQPDCANKLVLMMRKARSRPGYVNLECPHRKQNLYIPCFDQCMVKVGDSHFLSSELYQRARINSLSHISMFMAESHGPAVKVTFDHEKLDMDTADSFPCYNWPSEANEWASRPRLHNWPNKVLRDQIVQGGCHLVPVGDKTSANPALQWRISFVIAERKLIHSLSHVQFLVYGLLKYILKQTAEMMKQILGEEEILSSYIMKTVIFHVVESTPESFWQEKNMFLCFMFCLKILVSWVKVGYCPNYFITKNNMFLGKVQGENQRKLLRFLTDLHDLKWECLSVGTCIKPSIGERIRRVRNGAWKYVLTSPTHSERERDSAIFSECFFINALTENLNLSLELFPASTSNIDEFLGYFNTVQALSHEGVKIFSEHTAARGNKEKYRYFKKCKNLLRPFSTVCTSPGLLRLATFYYQTGNYMKTLQICDPMISSPSTYISSFSWRTRDWDMYERLYCGRGYSLLHKCKAFCSDINFSKNTLQLCPSQLLQEIKLRLETVPSHVFQFLALKLQLDKKTVQDLMKLPIPPLPYAMFLSFLCHYELGDTRRRDEAFIHLQTVKHDERQGVASHWIVHNLLGICYELVGDKNSALVEYRDSLIQQRQNQAPTNTFDILRQMLQHLY